MDIKRIYEERRSVNNFNPQKEISNTQLKEIVDLAVLAPSAFNLQPWRILAVKSPEQKERLMALSNNQPKVKEASVVLIIVGDREGYRPENSVWSELETLAGPEAAEGAKGAAAFLYGSSEERKIKFAESNAGLLGMSLMLAAKDQGIDSHPMSGIDFQGIKEAFALGDSEEVVMLVALGYHDDSIPLYPRRSRKGFDEIVDVL